MADTTFTSGTVVASAWLNDVNQVAYRNEVSVTNYASLSAAAASSAASLLIPSGTYTVSSNLTFNVPVRMLQGAVLNIATGVTVTFNGTFTAGVYKVFNCTGTGAVVFAPSKTVSGYVEWWGAVSNDGAPATATSNVKAINAANIALRKVEMMPGLYYTDDTIKITQGYRTLRGAGSLYDGTSNLQATRILCTSASATVLQLGPDTYPGSVNAMPEEIVAEDLLIDRGTAPTISSNACGVLVQYTLNSRAVRVRSETSIYGWRFNGTVFFKGDDLYAFRQTAGAGGGADRFWGFYIDGSASIGLNGGNASLYLNRCAASIGGLSIADSSGFYLDQKFTDCFIAWPETSSCAAGINVQGDASNTTLNYNNLDLIIHNPVLDTFSFTGIFLKNINKFGAVEIQGGFYGATATASNCIYVQDSQGAISITGGQCWPVAATSIGGVLIQASKRVTIDGLSINECGTTALALENSSNCDIHAIIKNESVTGGAAVQLTNACLANKIAPTISGKASAFTYGIQVVGTTDARNEYNVSGIDSGCLAVSTRKLTRNGVDITATGLTGTNLASGVMT